MKGQGEARGGGGGESRKDAEERRMVVRGVVDSGREREREGRKRITLCVQARLDTDGILYGISPELHITPSLQTVLAISGGGYFCYTMRIRVC